MKNNCTLCKTKIIEHAHVQAKRNFFDNGNHLLQNIIPLCPTCHSLFDLGYITIHPNYRFFIFSLIREKKNILRPFKYSYPYFNNLKSISDKNIKWQAKYEFKRKYGFNEYSQRYPKPPPLKFIYLKYSDQ